MPRNVVLVNYEVESEVVLSKLYIRNNVNSSGPAADSPTKVVVSQVPCT